MAISDNLSEIICVWGSIVNGTCECDIYPGWDEAALSQLIGKSVCSYPTEATNILWKCILIFNTVCLIGMVAVVIMRRQWSWGASLLSLCVVTVYWAGILKIKSASAQIFISRLYTYLVLTYILGYLTLSIMKLRKLIRFLKTKAQKLTQKTFHMSLRGYKLIESLFGTSFLAIGIANDISHSYEAIRIIMIFVTSLTVCVGTSLVYDISSCLKEMENELQLLTSFEDKEVNIMSTEKFKLVQLRTKNVASTLKALRLVYFIGFAYISVGCFSIIFEKGFYYCDFMCTLLIFVGQIMNAASVLITLKFFRLKNIIAKMSLSSFAAKRRGVIHVSPSRSKISSRFKISSLDWKSGDV